MKRCQSCGRLIELLEDFAGLDQSSNYCCSCADDSGKIKSFEEVLDNLTQRIAKTDGFDESASRNAALQILGRQPAWEPRFRKEEGMKTNKRRVTIISVTAILVLVAGSATWLFASNYYENKMWSREIHIAKYDNPFSNISKTESNGYEITEFRCKGDQELTNLENGILQFQSYEDAAYIENNKKFINMDDIRYSSYVYNIESRKGMDLGSIGTWDDEKLTNNLVSMVDGKLATIGWTSSFNVEDEEQHASELLQDTGPVNIGAGLSHKVKFDLAGKRFLQDNISDGEVICRFGQKTIETYPGMTNRYGFDHYLFIIEEVMWSPVIRRKINLGNRYAHLNGIKNNIAVLDCQNATGDPEEKSFLVVNLENNETLFIPANYCSFKLMIDKNRFIFTNPKSELYMFDVSSKTQHLIGKIENNMNVLGFSQSGTDIDVVLSIRDKHGYNKSFWKINSKLGKPLKIYDGKYMSYVGISGMNIIWYTFDEDMKYTENAEVVARQEKAKSKGRIVKTDIGTGSTENIITDTNLTINVKCDGSYLAWVRNVGPLGNQWQNICFTKLSETK